MPVACLCGFGPPELTQIGGAAPAIRPQWIRQVGIRSVDPGERRFVHEQELAVFDMRYIDEMGVRDGHGARAGGSAPGHPRARELRRRLPGSRNRARRRHHRRGGMSYREAQLCMEMIADTGLMGSLDIMELNPALDVRNKTAALAVDLVESLFGKSTLMRQPRSTRDARACGLDASACSSADGTERRVALAPNLPR